MSEVKKPVITKEQADAVETFLEKGTKEELLTAKVHCCHFGDEYSGINTIDIMTLAAALINGYEVEKTPEEKLREWFEEEREIGDEYYNRGEEHRSQDVVQTIIDTLDILGINIEGVNA